MKCCLYFLAFAIAFAQTTPNKTVLGEITAADISAKQLQVKGDDGMNYIVTVEDNTSLLRLPLGEKDLKKADKITLPDVTVGDRLLARGFLPVGSNTLPARTVVIMSKSDVAKKQAQDRAEWQRRGIAGTIVTVKSGTQEITINTHGREPNDVVVDASAAAFRRYAPESIRFADARPSSFADLQPGDSVRILGTKSEDGTHYKAEELVSGSFQTIAATVTSVDPATGELVVTDLQTKKAVTVKTNQNSMLRRLPEMMATMLARRLRPDANAAGAAAADGRGNGEAPTGGRGAGEGGRGFGGRGGAGGDLQQMLERAPQLSLAELKKGDALIISSSKSGEGAPITAMALVAGVEPFLAAAPKTAGQVNLGSWNLDVGVPAE